MTFQFPPRPTFRSFFGVPETKATPPQEPVEVWRVKEMLGAIPRGRVVSIEFIKHVMASYIQQADLLEKTRAALSAAGTDEINLREQLARKAQENPDEKELRSRLAQAKQWNRNQTAKVRELQAALEKAKTEGPNPGMEAELENLKSALSATRQVAEAQGAAFRQALYTPQQIESWRQDSVALQRVVSGLLKYCSDIEQDVKKYIPRQAAPAVAVMPDRGF